MTAGYDLGLSIAGSSGAQGGDIRGGEFIVGGSGGANQIPAWLWIVLAGVAVLITLKILFSKSKR